MVDRVDDFIKRAESRSLEDVTDSLNAIAESVLELRKALEAIKIEPYIHVTSKIPEIKLPDIHLKEVIKVNLPPGFIFLAMTAPYIILIGAALIYRFLPAMAAKWTSFN